MGDAEKKRIKLRCWTIPFFFFFFFYQPSQRAAFSASSRSALGFECSQPSRPFGTWRAPFWLSRPRASFCLLALRLFSRMCPVLFVNSRSPLSPSLVARPLACLPRCSRGPQAARRVLPGLTGRRRAASSPRRPCTGDTRPAGRLSPRAPASAPRPRRRGTGGRTARGTPRRAPRSTRRTWEAATGRPAGPAAPRSCHTGARRQGGVKREREREGRGRGQASHLPAAGTLLWPE